MRSLELIQMLDNKTNVERRYVVEATLENLGVKYRREKYETGVNIVADLGSADKRIGVSSHFDRVASSAGANDNASAIAVCMEIVERFFNLRNNNLGIRIFFFDEEETGLKGSTAYVKKYGVDDLMGLINMELVGLGDRVAVWPVNEHDSSELLKTFESVAERNAVVSKRFDRIVTNTADHLAFQRAGLKDAFTITCASEKDVKVAEHYYKALEFEVDKSALIEILSTAPIFEHYHQPTDTFDKLCERSLEMTTSLVWEAILKTHGFDV